jgi:hypothetical protein
VSEREAFEGWAAAGPKRIDAWSAWQARAAIGARCEADALLLRAARQLRRWHDKYGEHRPEWLPPPGEVELQEAIAAFLSDGRSLRY